MIYDSVLTCKICNQYMVDPVLVRSCFHTFCRFCAIQQIRQNQSKCPVCEKDYNLNESEALVRDTLLSNKLRQHASPEYFIKINSDPQFQDKRVPSSYEVVVLRDNNLSSLVSSLCAPYEKISFCLEYRSDSNQLDSICDQHPSTSSQTYVELGSGQQPMIIKSEPDDKLNMASGNAYQIVTDFYRSEKDVRRNTCCSRCERNAIGRQDGRQGWKEKQVLFRRYFMASALTSLEALQLLLQRILNTDSNGFTLSFLDLDGKTALSNKWSLRDVGYIFGWDRQSILTINFVLKSTLKPHPIESRPFEESVELNVVPVSSVTVQPVHSFSESSNLRSIPRSPYATATNSAEAKTSLKRKLANSATKCCSRSWRKRQRKSPKTSKLEVPDDPVVVRRVRYILMHGHPPPDKVPYKTSKSIVSSDCEVEKKQTTKPTSLNMSKVSPKKYQKIGAKCKKLVTVTLTSSLKDETVLAVSKEKQAPRDLTSTRRCLRSAANDDVQELEVCSRVQQSPSNDKHNCTTPTSRKCLSTTSTTSRESSVVSCSSDAPAVGDLCKSVVDEDVPLRSYAYNCKSRICLARKMRRILVGGRLSPSFATYELRNRRSSPHSLRPLLSRTVK